MAAKPPLHGGFLSATSGMRSEGHQRSFGHDTPYPHSGDPRLHHSMPSGGHQPPQAGFMPQQGRGHSDGQHSGPYGANSSGGGGGYTGSQHGPYSGQHGPGDGHGGQHGPGGGHGYGGHGGGHGPGGHGVGHSGGGHGGGHGGGGHSSHNDYAKFSRSSIFVPSTWNLNSSKAGFVDFVGRIVRQLDHQYTSDHGTMHGNYPHSGHGGMGMGGHGHGHGGYGMGMGGHGHGHGMGGHGGHGMSMYGGHGGMGGRSGMHPAASMVSIAHDPHGMFSHPGNMSRMHMGLGRAHFSSKAVPTTCPRCKHEIMTLVRRRPNVLNVAASTGAVVAGLIFKLPVALLPLAMLPLQVKALQPKVHYCPRCNFKLGKNVKISVPFERSARQPSPD